MGRFNIEDKKVMAGVDLGASHVRCLIGVRSGNEITIAGSACATHNGLYKGRIVNIKSASEALKKAIEEAEVTAGLQSSHIFLGINSGYHIFSSKGMAIIPSGQVTSDDVNKAVETAKAVPLSTGHRLLHVLPKSFTVDREGPFFNPLGLSGLRLETSVMIVSVPETNVQNTLQCLRYAGYSARALVLQPLATSLSLLNTDETKSGVCIVDMGQDQSSLMVVKDSRVKHISSFSIGGEDFTHDLMMELKIPRDKAEYIKLQYGNIMSKADWEEEDSPIEEGKKWEITVSAKKVNAVLSARAELFFKEVREQLSALSYFDQLEEGVVLTGGASQLKGMVEAGRAIIDKPVRKAWIKDFPGLNELENKNTFATALGILCYVQNESVLDYRSHYSDGHAQKLKRWVQDLFM